MMNYVYSSFSKIFVRVTGLSVRGWDLRTKIKVGWCFSNVLQVPTGEVLTYGDNDFVKFEEMGIKEVQKAAFVLVAGGLGERLGYNGIKVFLY